MGILINFEGGEGSGKGTQVRLLADFLEEQGHKVFVGREPGTDPVSEQIRRVVQHGKNKVSPKAELLLYNASRAQFTDFMLKEALDTHDFVILDRFYDSTTVYQGHARGLDLDEVHKMNMFATDGLIPNMTFILDVSPEIGMKRVEKGEFGEHGDRFENEKMDFHEKIRQGYLDLAQTHSRFTVVDTNNNDITEVFNIIQNKVVEEIKSMSKLKFTRLHRRQKT